MLILIPKRRPTTLTWLQENGYNWDLEFNETYWEKIEKYLEENGEQKRDKKEEEVKESKETPENTQESNN
jgi:hypothetical protein